MPASMIKSFAKKSGKSEAEVEKKWQEAKKAAGESYSEEGESEKFYGTATKILKRKLNLSEERITFADYVRPRAHAHVCEGIEALDFVKVFVKAGKANEKGLKEEEVDKKELEMGIEVEYEHTTDKEVAKRIALDHLAELPDYYTRLAKMEEEGKKELGLSEARGNWHSVSKATFKDEAQKRTIEQEMADYGLTRSETKFPNQKHNDIYFSGKRTDVDRVWKRLKAKGIEVG